MANLCSHCNSQDVAPLFDSFVCLECGRHTTTDGRQILPDSLCFDPSHNPTLRAWGWPYADVETSRQRGIDCCATQWGVPFAEGGPDMSDEEVPV